MKILKSFKNNSSAQNVFMFCMAMAFFGSAISMNLQALIAWLCCFVMFIMFCGERDHNSFLMIQLKELRSEQGQNVLVAEQADGKGQE